MLQNKVSTLTINFRSCSALHTHYTRAASSYMWIQIMKTIHLQYDGIMWVDAYYTYVYVMQSTRVLKLWSYGKWIHINAEFSQTDILLCDTILYFLFFRNVLVCIFITKYIYWVCLRWNTWVLMWFFLYRWRSITFLSTV